MTEYIIFVLAFLYCLQPRLALADLSLSIDLKKIPIYFTSADGEKTEPATPYRKREARKKGQVARSSDLNAAVVVIAIIIVIYSLGGYIGQTLSEYLRQILSYQMNNPLDNTQFIFIYKSSLIAFLRVMVPVFIVAIVFGILVNLTQVGVTLATEGLMPKLSNINPIEGFKRIFSKKALFNFVKTLIKLIVMSAVVYSLVEKSLPEISGLLNLELESSLKYFADLAFKISITAMGVFVAIAIVDFIYQKWEYNQSLKMSKEEIKKELKQTEGDPLIKSRIRERQRMVSMVRMLQAIPAATVVVTNPTHLAVVLKYTDEPEKQMISPQVVAKGAGYIAAKIKEIATEHDIPIIENKPVARALYKSTEIGDYIPVELYQAVAAIIAAVYSIRKKK
jgi:flagellar biosynthetic protein FlhB